MQNHIPTKMKHITDIAVHGVPFEILGFQMALSQKQCIFDPMMAKPRFVLEAVFL